MNKTMSLEISLEALIAGDRAEFARLVDAYSSPIYRLGLRMLGTPQDAEDVLQNTFINVLTHLSTFEDDPAFRRGSTASPRTKH